MSTRHYLLLILLGATWGSAFMFMRVAAPEFGPITLAATRVSSAVLLMLVLVLLLRQRLQLRQRWKTYLALGALNTAIPFAAYSFAALHIPAGYSAIANSTTPVWSALILGFWFRERINNRQWLGIIFAFAGVIALVGLQPIGLSLTTVVALSVALIGAAMYAVAGFLIRHYLSDLSGLAGATGLLLGAACCLALPGLVTAPSVLPSPSAWIAMLLLALICTAAAYVLAFYLLRHVGPQRTATAAFLFPAFAALWGWIFLSEPITANMLLGMGLVLIGTALTSLSHPATGPTRPWERLRDWVLWPLLYTLGPAPLRRHILRRYQRGEHYFREEVHALRRHLPQWLPEADLHQACRDQRLTRFIDRADVFMSRLRLRHTLRHHVEQHQLPPAGPPQLLLSAHYGNGWWALPALSAQGAPAHMVLAPPPATRGRSRVWQPYWALRWREVNRLSAAPIIEKQGASKHISATLATSGRVIALLDIPPSLAPRASAVRFLGRDTRLPRQSLDIATAQVAPPVEVWFFHGSFDPLTLRHHLHYQRLEHDGDAQQLLEAYARTLEALIRERPGLWHGWGDVEAYFPNA